MDALTGDINERNWDEAHAEPGEVEMVPFTEPGEAQMEPHVGQGRWGKLEDKRGEGDSSLLSYRYSGELLKGDV